MSTKHSNDTLEKSTLLPFQEKLIQLKNVGHKSEKPG